MNWEQLLITLVGAGLGTAIIQGGISLYQAKRSSLAHARFVSFRIATQLEAYAHMCTNYVSEIATFESSRGAMGKQFTHLPAFPEYPDDAEGWRWVSPEVMHLAFAVKVLAEQESYGLRFVRSEFGPEEAAEQCGISCELLKKRAFSTAQSIRQQYGFPARIEETPWPEQGR